MSTRLAALVAGVAALASNPSRGIEVDLSAYRPECGVEVRAEGDRLLVAWPMAEGDFGRLAIDLRPGHPLIESLGIAAGASGPVVPLAVGVEPATYLTVGTRGHSSTQAIEPGVFRVFFDAPAERPHQEYRVNLGLDRAMVRSEGRRATIALGGLSAGPFAGELRLTVYAGGRLLHVEAVLKTDEDGRAILYDAGLVGADPGWERIGWIDPEGAGQGAVVDLDATDRPTAVRHRLIVAGSKGGALACFPPPHQFFFPRDRTDNLATAWSGKAHRGSSDPFGIGVRQAEAGGGRYSPWSNAPPGTEQRLGVFYLLARGGIKDATREALAYTRGDRFAEVPGHVTFTSHWHMAITQAAMEAKARGEAPSIPDFADMFKTMGVQVVHLAEFHGDGHPRDPGPLRLPELDAMFAECRRLSDDDLLFLPGEEANVYLGVDGPGKLAGHWLYLFPKPVRWIMRHEPGKPFADSLPGGETLYRVGDRAEMLELLRRENGLAWTAHPRIKASSWAPDGYRDEAFYRDPAWLGAAWKAMPADLSSPRLGERCLDLFSDMSNWGGRKQMLGEVDVFQIDRTHELFGHMNINYLRLDRVPASDDDWQPILDALRGGRSFVTTGEVLIRDFTIGGRPSGEALDLSSTDHPEVRATIEWTFPPRFVELVSGDGRAVYRDRIDLADAEPFGSRTLSFAPDLRGRTWARLEAWDVAADGAFTQPVWLTGAGRE